MALLPNFFVMQATSGGPYLSVPENLPTSVPSGFLKFQEKQIWSPRAKFEAEQAETGDGTLVNIRCCYNNKYLVVHKLDDGYWVTASANEPQEDQTDPSCTLFQPQTGEQGRVCLFSVGMSMYATTSIGGDSADTADGLRISDSKKLDFNVVDWETLVVLPNQVSFKSGGKYLCSRVIETTPYLRFESGLEAEDPLVVHQLFPTADGNYRIKDLNSGKFWREGPSKWILDDGEEEETRADDEAFAFSFVKITEGVFAIRSLCSRNFCGTGKPESLDSEEEDNERDTDDGKADCLSALYPEITRGTKLIVEERVAVRDIFDITYRLSDARIYNKENKEVAQAFASNNTDTKTTFALTLAASGLNTTKWTNNASVTPGVKVNLDVTAVPIVVTNDSVELSNQYINDKHEWGVVETTEIAKEVSYISVVPPFTTTKTTLGCTKAACDVPFSYTQRDVLVSGEIVTSIKDDGMFTGVNHYGFYVENVVVKGKNDQSAN